MTTLRAATVAGWQEQLAHEARTSRRKELLERVQRYYEASERLDRVDYLGRRWLAEMAGDMDVIADALKALLEVQAGQESE